jgi:glucan phosphoethanolaminetransferase (alkaline phosphatase superfamily)
METLAQQRSIATRIANKTPYLLLFLFSVAINAAFGYRLNIVYCFTLFSLLLLILKFSRQLYITLTLFLTLIAAFYFPFAQVFGPPNYIIISSAFYTNESEATSFLSTIPTLYYVGSFLLIILGIRVTYLYINPAIKRTKLIIGFILLSVLFAPLKLTLTEAKFNLMDIGFTPVKFLIEAYQSIYSTYKQYKEFTQVISKKADWKDVSTHPLYKTYILVIGESARKDLMHNYGFPINNTPFISQSKGLFFNNYLSAGPGTIISLTHTLAKHHNNEIQLQNNIITLAEKAGFYTCWISNQGYLGKYDTPVSSIGKKADSSLFLQAKNLARYKNANDKELLPFVKYALNQPTGNKPKLIVVHLIGSHPPFCKRTNNQFDVYFRNKALSCYITTMHNTDTVLKNITKLAKSTGNSWSLMYFSDHGLGMIKGILEHTDKYQQDYRVPMFIISSNDSQKKTITTYRSALNFLFLFSQWTGINAKGLKTTCRYLTNEPCKNQTTVILADNKTKKDINNLPIDPFIGCTN